MARNDGVQAGVAGTMKSPKVSTTSLAANSNETDPDATGKGIVQPSRRLVASSQEESLANDSFREQMIALLPRLSAFALSLTSNADLRDDLVQETCARALRHQDQWQAGTRLDRWMFRIALNQWLDWKRSAKRRGATVHVEEDNYPSNSDGRVVTENRLALAEVLRGLDQLRSEQRALIAMVCVDGLTYQEASEILGVPVGTVMSRVARARLALHDAMHRVQLSGAKTKTETRRGRGVR
jgi:RNA polymerase sigma-70 factor (ECF subfamily)